MDNSKKNTLNRVLVKLMAECEIDDVKLSKYTDVPISTIARMRLKPDANPTISSLTPIANFFNISVDQLLGYCPISNDRLPGSHNPITYTSSLLPVIEWSDTLSYVKNEHDEMKYKISNWVSSEELFSDEAFAVIVRTNSYGLFVKENSLILVDPASKIKDGCIALFTSTETSKIFLRYVIMDCDSVYTKSINPEIKGTSIIQSDYVLLGIVAEIRYKFHKDMGNIKSTIPNSFSLVRKMINSSTK